MSTRPNSWGASGVLPLLIPLHIPSKPAHLERESLMQLLVIMPILTSRNRALSVQLLR